ncbi:MAG: hypothetical protein Q4C23_03615 [Mycoplasmatota bacterium]|nr:hypothetical protein [Mycoplasmatota bacterium]
MNQNSELLLYIYQNAEMGVKSTTQLINLLNKSDNKIKTTVEKQLKGYESFLKKSQNLLKKNKISPKGTNIIAKISSSIGISMEFMKDNSDAKIADMLIRGFTMGNIDIDKLIDKYKNEADKNIIHLAKELKKFGEENIELLKSYL